jgi:hypothetical protein
MGAVVVHDQMDLKFLGHPLIDDVEELAEFDRPMPSVKLSDHFAAFVSRAANSVVVPCRL